MNSRMCPFLHSKTFSQKKVPPLLLSGLRIRVGRRFALLIAVLLVAAAVAKGRRCAQGEGGRLWQG